MQQWKRYWARITAVFLVCLTLLHLAPSSYAQEVMQGNRIESGESVAQDVILNGRSIVLDGTVAGDVFALGNTIVINGGVEGSLFVIGENVIINGEVSHSVYALALNLELLPSSEIGRSLYFLGSRLTHNEDAGIGRDLTAVTLGAALRGEIGRDVRALVGLVEIGQRLLNLINTASGAPELTGTPPAGVADLAGQEAMLFVTQTDLLDSHLTAAQQEEEPEIDAAPNPAVTTLLAIVRQLASFLIVGLLLIWLAPTQLTSWAEQLQARPLPAAGLGLILYVAGFVGAGILVALVTAVGLTLRFFFLYELGWLAWGLGYTAVGFTFTTFILLVYAVSKIIVAYLAGWLILQRLAPQTAGRRVLPLLLGLLIYVLIGAIPFLGWVVAMVATFLGIGAVWLAYTRPGHTRPAPAVEPSAT